LNVIGVALEIEHQADRLFQVAFIAAGRHALDLAVGHGRRDPLLDAVAGLLVGNLADDDPLAPLAELLDPGSCPEHDRRPPGVITLTNPGPAADHAAGGKVGTRTEFHQLVDRYVRLVDHLHERVADLAQVMRRDRRGHAHRDAARSVDQ